MSFINTVFLGMTDWFSSDNMNSIVNALVGIGSGLCTWFAARYKNKNDEFKAILEANAQLREGVLKELATVKEENKEIREESRLLREENRKLNEKIDKLEQENREQKYTLSEYKNKITAYEQEIISLKSKITALENKDIGLFGGKFQKDF